MVKRVSLYSYRSNLNQMRELFLDILVDKKRWVIRDFLQPTFLTLKGIHYTNQPILLINIGSPSSKNAASNMSKEPDSFTPW